jgi:quinol monooxygenase YgiN
VQGSGFPLAAPKESAMSSAKDPDDGVVLINVFIVDPANQDRLVSLLTKATDGLVNRAPGFLSATLHRSVDGTKVTMYAKWRSAADYEAMRKDPAPLPFLREAMTFATFEPGMYRIERTFLPEV